LHESNDASVGDLNGDGELKNLGADAEDRLTILKRESSA